MGRDLAPPLLAVPLRGRAALRFEGEAEELRPLRSRRWVHRQRLDLVHAVVDLRDGLRDEEALARRGDAAERVGAVEGRQSVCALQFEEAVAVDGVAQKSSAGRPPCGAIAITLFTVVVYVAIAFRFAIAFLEAWGSAIFIAPLLILRYLANEESLAGGSGVGSAKVIQNVRREDEQGGR